MFPVCELLLETLGAYFQLEFLTRSKVRDPYSRPAVFFPVPTGFSVSVPGNRPSCDCQTGSGYLWWNLLNWQRILTYCHSSGFIPAFETQPAMRPGWHQILIHQAMAAPHCYQPSAGNRHLPQAPHKGLSPCRPWVEALGIDRSTG